MPSEASIYGLIRQPQPVALENPDAIAERRMRLDALMGQREMQGLQLQGARDEMGRRQRLQDLFSTNPNATPDDVARVDYEAAQKLRRAGIEDAGKQATTRKTLTEADKILAQQGRDMIAQANPQNYGAILQWGVENGQKWAMGAPTQFDPRWQAQMVQTADEWLKRNAPTLAEQETGRANLAREANAAGQLAVARGNLGVAQGRLGLERQAAEQGRWTNDLERGIQINTATGETRPMTAGGAPIGAKDKPLTESQARGGMFGTRAAESDKILTQLEGEYGRLGLAMKQGAEGMPLVGGSLGTAANALLSSNQQRAEQAQRDFVNAVLRQESGAVISPSEFENARKQYFPQPGDSDAVVKQKRANRQTAIEGFRVMAGPGGGRIDAARLPQESGGRITDPRKTIPDSAPTREQIDAELRRRGVIR